ncbi:hypothetical protein C8F04DRAFT_990742 [Mycena alexandri]|uniref:Uncharacterized protein n=1 Tax=Mycena alexandri TaxID=1745969 RepID=A0AAD6TDR4_9AGAR|nr:hypothetical protein C8F04DRAFT_990742 [Mycena alexandri]
MLWVPTIRKTRSGTEFAGVPRTVLVFQERTFDYAPLVHRAVACEHDDQVDVEEHDEDDVDDPLNAVDDQSPPSALEPNAFDTVDDQYPPLPPAPPHDPFNDVDDENPHPKKRRRRVSFDEVVASASTPHTGAHRRRPASPPNVPRKKKNSNAAHARRKLKRSQDKAALGHKPTASTLHAHVHPAVPLESALDASSLPSTFGAYAAKVEAPDERRGRTVWRSLLEFTARGFRIIQWDGIHPRPILDCYGRIVAVLAGQPDRPEYRASTDLAFTAMRNATNTTRFPAAMKKHRRGLFAAVNVGLSYGKGQSIPGWLDGKDYRELAEEMLANAGIQRMAGFADAAFAIWAPRLYQYYRKCDAKLRVRHPDLRRPFVGSVYFCAAFNFGRNVWTFKHRDVLNLAFGWCAIQALGRYDATLGGHLVLWDLKLVVEFPHGALILLPSATVAHSNIPVRAGEERVSFTQFSAGGIFRYVDNGCQTVAELERKNPEEFARLSAQMASRWEEGLALLSTLDELIGVEL